MYEENIISEDSKIEDIVDKIEGISEYFINIFKEKSTLTVNKTLAIFDYYLKNIYEDISFEIKQYQEDLNDNSQEIIVATINRFFYKITTF